MCQLSYDSQSIFVQLWFDVYCLQNDEKRRRKRRTVVVYMYLYVIETAACR